MKASLPQSAMRYGRALYETGAQAGELAALGQDMEFLDRVFRELPAAREFCTTPHQNKARELEFLQAIFLSHVGQRTAALIQLAWRNRRLDLLPLLPAAWQQLQAEQAGTVEVVLEAARETDPELQDLVRRHMASVTGAPVQLETRVNPALLGGFRILWQNKILDQSARGRLTALRSRLKSV